MARSSPGRAQHSRVCCESDTGTGVGRTCRERLLIHGATGALSQPSLCPHVHGDRGEDLSHWDGMERGVGASQSGALRGAMLPAWTHPNMGTRSIPRGGSASGAVPWHQDGVGEDAGDGGIEGQRDGWILGCRQRPGVPAALAQRGSASCS